MSREAEAWKEQTAFEREQRDAKIARIVRVATEHPDMPLMLLSERFGETVAMIRHVLGAAGVRREPDYFSDSINHKRKMG